MAQLKLGGTINEKIILNHAIINVMNMNVFNLIFSQFSINE